MAAPFFWDKNMTWNNWWYQTSIFPNAMASIVRLMQLTEKIPTTRKKVKIAPPMIYSPGSVDSCVSGKIQALRDFYADPMAAGIRRCTYL
jgi:hypothetical protein